MHPNSHLSYSIIWRASLWAVISSREWDPYGGVSSLTERKDKDCFISHYSPLQEEKQSKKTVIYDPQKEPSSEPSQLWEINLCWLSHFLVSQSSTNWILQCWEKLKKWMKMHTCLHIKEPTFSFPFCWFNELPLPQFQQTCLKELSSWLHCMWMCK